MLFRSVLVVALLTVTSALYTRDAVKDDDADRYRMPPNILWGSSVSAVQTEGALLEGGKTESVVDHVILSGKLPDTYWTSHEVAADSYHRYKEDVAMAAQLKLKTYKFSIAWPRVLPTADATKPNAEGVAYYHNLIDEILAHGMIPMATMNHFDHPQLLEDEFMGWQSRKMVDKFAEYSKFLFDTYGAKVPIFVTINEPNIYCTYFNAQFVRAGFRTEAEVDPYQCVHNHVLAHQAAYKIYQQGKQEGKYDGKIGYSVILILTQPATAAPEDVYAADVSNQLFAGTSLNPVVFGDYPQVIKTLLGDKLPSFTEAEKADLVDSTDFVGINVYDGLTATYNRFKNTTYTSGFLSRVIGQMTKDMSFIDLTVNGGDGGQAKTDPAVMKNALLWAWNLYKKPIFITENGYSDVVLHGTHDAPRAAYFSAILRSLVTTVKDYGVDVMAYSAWSLIDSFEFSSNYNRPFGLVHVDYEGKTLDRSLKDSSTFWTTLAETGVVPLVEIPDEATTTVAPSTAPTTAPSTAPTTAPTTTPSTASTTPRSGATSLTISALPMALAALCMLARPA